MSRDVNIRRARLHGAWLAVVWLAAACPLRAFAAPTFDYTNYRPYEARIPALTSTSAFGVCGSFGILVDAGGAAQVWDLADPLSPRLVNQIQLPSTTNYVAVSGRFLLVGDRDPAPDSYSYMRLYELGADGSLVMRTGGSMYWPLSMHYYDARGFTSSGDLCFVGGTREFGYTGPIFIYRVAAASAVPVGIIAGPSWPLAMAVKGSRLFVTSSYTGIAWFDFTPDGAVVRSGTLAFGAATRALAVAGDLLLAVEPDGTMDILDAVAAGGPVPVSRTWIGGVANQLAIRGDQAFVADAYLGIRQVDFTNRAAPVAVDTLWTTAGATQVADLGGFVAVAARGDGVEIIDPGAPYQQPARHVLPWLCGAFAVRGSLVFGAAIVDGSQRAVLVDIADAAAPRVIGSMPHNWGVTTGQWALMTDGLAVLSSRDTGSVLYGWDAARGLTGFAQLTAPGAPAASAVFHGTDLFLDNSDYGPGWLIGAGAFPHITSQAIKASGVGRAFTVGGCLLWGNGYKGYGTYHLTAWDISDPGAPQLRAANPVSGSVISLLVGGDVLVAGGTPSRLFDISRPNAITVLSELPGINGASAVALHDEVVYARSSSGIDACSIQDIRVPQYLGRALGPVPSFGVNDDWLLAGGAGGLMFFAKPAGGGAVAVAPEPGSGGGQLEASPNPFNPRLSVTLNLRRGGPVTVEVFDVRGRRVAGLLRSDAPPGPLTVSWDGREDSGSPAPSGSYVIRATTADGAAADKVTLLR